jgi:hypothetical protein
MGHLADLSRGKRFERSQDASGIVIKDESLPVQSMKGYVHKLSVIVRVDRNWSFRSLRKKWIVDMLTYKYFERQDKMKMPQLDVTQA